MGWGYHPNGKYRDNQRPHGCLLNNVSESHLGSEP